VDSEGSGAWAATAGFPSTPRPPLGRSTTTPGVLAQAAGRPKRIEGLRPGAPGAGNAGLQQWGFSSHG